MADALTERCWFCTKLCDAERGCLVAPEAYAGHDVLACSDNHFNRAYEMAMGMKPANRTFYDFARVAERRDKGRGKDYGFRIKEIIFEPNFPPYRRDELSKSLRAETFEAKGLDIPTDCVCGEKLQVMDKKDHVKLVCYSCSDFVILPKSHLSDSNKRELIMIQEGFEENKKNEAFHKKYPHGLGRVDLSGIFVAETFEATCRDCYGTGGLYDSRLGIDDECATCGGTGESFEEKIDIDDFNKVADAIQAVGQPATVLFETKFGTPKIVVVLGDDIYDDENVEIVFDILDDLKIPFNSSSVVGDTTTLERKEYDILRKINGGHKDFLAESFDAEGIITGKNFYNLYSLSGKYHPEDSPYGDFYYFDRRKANTQTLNELKEQFHAKLGSPNNRSGKFDEMFDELLGAWIAFYPNLDNAEVITVGIETDSKNKRKRPYTTDVEDWLGLILEDSRQYGRNNYTKTIIPENLPYSSYGDYPQFTIRNRPQKQDNRHDYFNNHEINLDFIDPLPSEKSNEVEADITLTMENGDLWKAFPVKFTRSGNRLGAETFEASRKKTDFSDLPIQYKNNRMNSAICISKPDDSGDSLCGKAQFAMYCGTSVGKEISCAKCKSLFTKMTDEEKEKVRAYGFGAESVSDLELKKDSCCCGATKKTPCVCMILGSDCSAKKPMCACYRLKEIQQKDEKGAETFEASTGDIEMDRYLLKEQMERFKDNPDMLKEIEIMVQLYGVGGALNRIEIADEMEREEREREKEESEKRYKGWLKKTKGLTKELKKDPRYRSPFNAESFEAEKRDGRDMTLDEIEETYGEGRLCFLCFDGVMERGEMGFGRDATGTIYTCSNCGVREGMGLNAESFEAKGDDKYYINNRPQWMPKLMKDSVENEEEGTYNRHDKGYVAGLFLKSVNDARLNGILKQTNYQDSDVVGFIMPFDLITRKLAKDYEPIVLKDQFGKSKKYLVINGTPYNYDIFNSMLMRLPPTTEVRISGKPKYPLMFEFKFLNENYLMFLAPYVGDDFDASQHGDFAKEVMSKSGAGFGFKSPLPENWEERKKMSKELKDKQLREDIEKVVAVGHSYDPSKEPLLLSPPVPQWNERKWERGTVEESSEGNDPDFDPEKADRDNDGEISDWERAVGNAVAKGIREHKEKKGAESRPVSYMVKSDAHKLNEASKRIHDKADEGREYPEWWKSKLSVARNNADQLADFLDYAVVEGVFESEGDHDHEEIDELIDKLNTVVDFAITFVHDGGYGGEPKGILVDEDLGIKTEIVHYIEGSIQLNLVRDIDTDELLSVRFSLTGDPDQTPIVYLPLPEEITTVPEDDRVSAKN